MGTDSPNNPKNPRPLTSRAAGPGPYRPSSPGARPTSPYRASTSSASPKGRLTERFSIAATSSGGNHEGNTHTAEDDKARGSKSSATSSATVSTTASMSGSLNLSGNLNFVKMSSSVNPSKAAASVSPVRRSITSPAVPNRPTQVPGTPTTASASLTGGPGGAGGGSIITGAPSAKGKGIVGGKMIGRSNDLAATSSSPSKAAEAAAATLAFAGKSPSISPTKPLTATTSISSQKSTESNVSSSSRAKQPSSSPTKSAKNNPSASPTKASQNPVTNSASRGASTGVYERLSGGRAAEQERIRHRREAEEAKRRILMDREEEEMSRKKKSYVVRPSVLVQVKPINLTQCEELFFGEPDPKKRKSPQFQYEAPREVVEKVFSKNCSIDLSLMREAREILSIVEKMGDPATGKLGCEVYQKQLYGDDNMDGKELEMYVRRYLADLQIREKVEVRSGKGKLAAANVTKNIDGYVVNLTSEGASRRMVQGLCDHEIGTHLLRMINEDKQVWSNKEMVGNRKRFGIKAWSKKPDEPTNLPAFPDTLLPASRGRSGWLVARSWPDASCHTTEFRDFAGWETNPWITEEGLATLNTFYSMKTKLLFPQAVRYYAVCKGTELGFKDLFNLLAPHMPDEKKRWNLCCRVKRGLFDTGRPGSFYIDQAYFLGAVLILRHLREIPDLSILYAGQIALEDLTRVHYLTRYELIKLPSFFKDVKQMEKWKQHCRQLLIENKLEKSVDESKMNLDGDSQTSANANGVDSGPNSPTNKGNPPMTIPGIGNNANNHTNIDQETMNSAINSSSSSSDPVGYGYGSPSKENRSVSAAPPSVADHLRNALSPQARGGMASMSLSRARSGSQSSLSPQARRMSSGAMNLSGNFSPNDMLNLSPPMSPAVLNSGVAENSPTNSPSHRRSGSFDTNYGGRGMFGHTFSGSPHHRPSYTSGGFGENLNSHTFYSAGNHGNSISSRSRSASPVKGSLIGGGSTMGTSASASALPINQKGLLMQKSSSTAAIGATAGLAASIFGSSAVGANPGNSKNPIKEKIPSSIWKSLSPKASKEKNGGGKNSNGNTNSNNTNNSGSNAPGTPKRTGTAVVTSNGMSSVNTENQNGMSPTASPAKMEREQGKLVNKIFLRKVRTLPSQGSYANRQQLVMNNRKQFQFNATAEVNGNSGTGNGNIGNSSSLNRTAPTSAATANTITSNTGVSGTIVSSAGQSRSKSQGAGGSKSKATPRNKTGIPIGCSTLTWEDASKGISSDSVAKSAGNGNSSNAGISGSKGRPGSTAKRTGRFSSSMNQPQSPSASRPGSTPNASGINKKSNPGADLSQVILNMKRGGMIQFGGNNNSNNGNSNNKTSNGLADSELPESSQAKQFFVEGSQRGERRSSRRMANDVANVTTAEGNAGVNECAGEAGTPKIQTFKGTGDSNIQFLTGNIVRKIRTFAERAKAKKEHTNDQGVSTSILIGEDADGNEAEIGDASLKATVSKSGGKASSEKTGEKKDKKKTSKKKNSASSNSATVERGGDKTAMIMSSSKSKAAAAAATANEIVKAAQGGGISEKQPKKLAKAVKKLKSLVKKKSSKEKKGSAGGSGATPADSVTPDSTKTTNPGDSVQPSTNHPSSENVGLDYAALLGGRRGLDRLEGEKNDRNPSHSGNQEQSESNPKNFDTKPLVKSVLERIGCIGNPVGKASRFSPKSDNAPTQAGNTASNVGGSTVKLPAIGATTSATKPSVVSNSRYYRVASPERVDSSNSSKTSSKVRGLNQVGNRQSVLTSAGTSALGERVASLGASPTFIQAVSPSVAVGSSNLASTQPVAAALDSGNLNAGAGGQTHNATAPLVGLSSLTNPTASSFRGRAFEKDLIRGGRRASGGKLVMGAGQVNYGNVDSTVNASGSDAAVSGITGVHEVVAPAGMAPGRAVGGGIGRTSSYNGSANTGGGVTGDRRQSIPVKTLSLDL